MKNQNISLEQLREAATRLRKSQHCLLSFTTESTPDSLYSVTYAIDDTKKGDRKMFEAGLRSLLFHLNQVLVGG